MQNLVEFYHSGERICLHVQLYGLRVEYSTYTSHMPPKHRQYEKWSADLFREKASAIGSNTLAVVNAILASHKIEQQVSEKLLFAFICQKNILRNALKAPVRRRCHALSSRRIR
jgi:hypothetical protein